MDIKFYGFKKINRRYQTRLRKIAFQWISDHMDSIDEVHQQRVLSELNRFDITIMPTDLKSKLYPRQWTPRQDGVMSDMIPWEVVGQYKIQLFIIDRTDDMFLVSGIMALTHGLGHALLYSYDKHRRITLRHRDASGNEKGDELNWFSAAVHNRTEEIHKVIQQADDPELDNQIYYLQTYREMFPRLWKKVKYRAYDFRDDLR